jgi:mannose-6-phosphate isomerase-like protein (cupin superfamily)
MVVNKKTAEHYTWGSQSDAWHFLRREDLSVILEEVPAGESEARHYHRRSRQFFYVLSGTFTMDVGGTVIELHAEEGLEIAPGMPHRMYNSSGAPVKFIVISMPQSHGDRVESE